MDVRTLDERIRAIARDELNYEVAQAMTPIKKYFNTGFHSDVEIAGQKIPVHTIIEKLEKKIVEVHKQNREDLAISGFIARVEQSPELKDSVGVK